MLLSHGFTGSPGLDEAVGRVPGRAGVRRRGAAAARATARRWQDLNKTTWTDWYAEVARRVRPAPRRGRRRRGRRAVDGRRRWCCGWPPTAATRSPASCWSTRPSPRKRKDVLALPVLKHVVPSLPGHRQRHQEAGRATSTATPGPRSRRCPLDDPGSGSRSSPTCRGSPQPLLYFRSADDHVVDALVLADHHQPGVVAATSTERLLENSYHVATLDNDAPQIFEESAEFVARVTSAS